MLFETQKKADTFIKFNSEEIKEENGFCPTRSYFCIACNGWHVTSHAENVNLLSKSEIAMDKYRLFIEAKERMKILDKIKRKERRKRLAKENDFNLDITTI